MNSDINITSDGTLPLVSRRTALLLSGAALGTVACQPEEAAAGQLLDELLSAHRTASAVMDAAYDLLRAKEVAYDKSVVSEPIVYETSVGVIVLHSDEDRDIIVSETAARKAPRLVVEAHEQRSEEARKKHAADDNRNGLRWSTRAGRDDYRTNVEPAFLADLEARKQALEHWTNRRSFMGVNAAVEAANIADKAEQDAMDAIALHPCASAAEARRKLDYLTENEFENRLDAYDDETRIAILYSLCGGRVEA